VCTLFNIAFLHSGGSETFKDKQDFFCHEVRQLHSKRLHERLPIKINRQELLRSVSRKSVSNQVVSVSFSEEHESHQKFLYQ
jgi:hypothetical protein